jgi:hypothetical protein
MELENGLGNNEAAETRDTLFLLGGVALVVFGTGLILSNPLVRRYLGGANLIGLAQAAVPDVERYLRLKNM